VDRDVRRRLGNLPNLRLTGPLPADEIPKALAGASVCLMPYRQRPFCQALFPIKLMESLAAGRPVVATPLRGIQGFSDVVSLASSPQGFADAIVKAAEEDSPAARRRRIERAQPFSWENRIEQMEQAIDVALGDGRKR
jgi:glycosyltransferase involved in cell wall biosynthesis